MDKKYVILTDEETKVIRDKIETELYKTLKKGWSPYWYPLKDIKDNIDVIAFDSDFWNDDNNMNLLLKILKSCNVKKVYTLQECSNVYIYEDFLNEFGLLEEDEDGYGYNFPYYSEQYIWDDSHKWFIYTSHEATVTFAGSCLVNALKNHLKNVYIENINVGDKKGCPHCGKVTWHINHMKNIIYQCPSCGMLFNLK